MRAPATAQPIPERARAPVPRALEHARRVGACPGPRDRKKGPPKTQGEQRHRDPPIANPPPPPLSPSPQVSVKWQKDTFDLDVDTAAPPSVFKAQLFALTGVPPDRQKIPVKGGLLRDDGDWAAAGVTDGKKLMMMGTADAVPVAPAGGVTFIEDRAGADANGDDAMAGDAPAGPPPHGVGLVNLGNTCYLASTLQCLYRVPELRAALAAYAPPPALADPAARLTAATRSLFASLAAADEPVRPDGVLASLRAAFPQFAQAGPGGVPAQQDAEECWSQLLTALKNALAASGGAGAGAPTPIARGSPIDALFGVRTRALLTCAESGETRTVDEAALALRCVITGDVNHVGEGIALGLKEDREAGSDALGRTVLFEGTSSITAAPPYLTVQLVRFFYKASSQQKAKILRKVAFPLTLDIYDWCAPDLQAALDGPRAAVAAAAAAAATAGRGGTVKEGEEKAAVKEEDVAAAAAAATAAEPAPPAAVPAGPSPYAGQPTGRYELTAVLTHKGRSADSGHYTAWVKAREEAAEHEGDAAAAAAATNGAPAGDADDGAGPSAPKKAKKPVPPGKARWVQFDDDGIVERTAEDALALSGGGDWHMAYVLVYRQVCAE